MQDKLKKIVVALMAITIVLGLAVEAKNKLVNLQTENLTYGYTIKLSK